VVISCGIPGTAMPHFDDQAYTDGRRYERGSGAWRTNAEFSSQHDVAEARSEVVADYLLAKIIGRGPIIREECLETFGPRARSCDDYPPG
jgi:hypothetical protein